jgi:hypothetical protein
MGSLLSLAPYAVAFAGGVIAGHAVPWLYDAVIGWVKGAATSTTTATASDVAAVATAVTSVVNAVEGVAGTTPAATTTTPAAK